MRNIIMQKSNKEDSIYTYTIEHKKRMEIYI